MLVSGSLSLGDLLFGQMVLDLHWSEIVGIMPADGDEQFIVLCTVANKTGEPNRVP